MRGSFVATFRPASHWSPEIQRHSGLRCRWRPGWIIEAGAFAGEVAFIPMAPRTGLAWAPRSELMDVEQL